MGTPNRLALILATQPNIINELSPNERATIVLGIVEKMKPSLKYLVGLKDISTRLSQGRRLGWDVRNHRIVSYPNKINGRTRVLRLFAHDGRPRPGEDSSQHRDDGWGFNILLTDDGQLLAWESCFRTVLKEGHSTSVGDFDVSHPVSKVTVRHIDDTELASIMEDSYTFMITIKTLTEIVNKTVEERDFRLSCMHALCSDVSAIVKRLSNSWNSCSGESQD